MLKRLCLIAFALPVYCGTLRGEDPPACEGVQLSLYAPSGDYTLAVDDEIVIAINLGCVGDPLYGYQAFVQIEQIDPIPSSQSDPASIEFVSGEYNGDIFGLPLVDPIYADANVVTSSAGVDFLHSQPPTETGGDIAYLTFRARAAGTCRLRFVGDEPPTCLSDGSFECVKAATPDSAIITVE